MLLVVLGYEFGFVLGELGVSRGDCCVYGGWWEMVEFGRLCI